MSKHLAFPSIEQYRNVISYVRKYADYPTNVIKFTGTVKAHGTNAAVCYNIEIGEIWSQSRSNVLSLEHDNAGFCQWVETHREYFKYEFFQLTVRMGIRGIQIPKIIAMYGEWCGGNIQRGVAITGLPKMFIGFALRYVHNNDTDNSISSTWDFDDPMPFSRCYKNPQTDEEIDINIYSVYDFGKWEIDVDFSQPELVQNQIVEWTEAVENECPIGKYFGVSGTGEGIVFHPSDFSNTSMLWKSKGEKHSATKVKTLAAVDVEVIKNMNILVDSLATENRFNQGLQVMTENSYDNTDPKNTKIFIEWVKNDVVKEEKDTILASGLDFGCVCGNILAKAGKWYNSRPV